MLLHYDDVIIVNECNIILPFQAHLLYPQAPMTHTLPIPAIDFCASSDYPRIQSLSYLFFSSLFSFFFRVPRSHLEPLIPNFPQPHTVHEPLTYNSSYKLLYSQNTHLPNSNVVTHTKISEQNETHAYNHPCSQHRVSRGKQNNITC